MTTIEALADRLGFPDAVLSRTDLGALGYPRRAVDAIFKECAKREGVQLIPGYSRPLIRVQTFRDVVADYSYGLDRVWP